jgi:hypothetical protein
MDERPKNELEDLPEKGEAKELTPEETEKVKGGVFMRGTRPRSGNIETDACDGGEVTSG